MAKEIVAVMTTPCEEVAADKLPVAAVKVRCHCPRECWANKATLELMLQDEVQPDPYCMKCAPEPIRSSAEFITKNRAALGIPEGAALKVELMDEQPQWPHGGNLN